MDLNSFSFTGRLGANAAVNKLPSGKYVMEMSVAINTGYGDYKKTLWVKVKIWGERTNNFVNLFTKGSLVTGSGELSAEEWQDRSGAIRTTLVVTCMNVQLISGKKPENEGPSEDEDSFEGILF